MAAIHVEIPSISGALGKLDGYKTYIGVALGAAAIVYSHVTGIAIPGLTTASDPNWLSELWTLYMLLAGRSALSKVGAKV